MPVQEEFRPLLWQEQPSQGGEQIRKTLQLDQRPVVLLAANVIGDSLTLKASF